MKALTKKQQRVLNAIAEFQQESGCPPTVRELGAILGLSSPATINHYLAVLEENGYIRRGKGKSRSVFLTESTPPEGIPILGTVAAGQPILAVEDAIGYLNYTPDRSGDYFALRVKGRSMINAGILDGDMVVVRKQQNALSGEIVIALIEDEATCKRLFLNGRSVLLMPENEEFQPIDGNEATILGKVTAVIRTYR